MKTMKTQFWSCGLVLAAAGLGLSACGTASKTQSLADACSAFKASELPHGATVTKTEVRAASPEMGTEACIVRGQIVSSPESTITWAVELPAKAAWNGKTLTIGGGGFDGFIPTDSEEYHQMAGPSAAPYVRMSSNSGHEIQGFYPWGTSDVALRNHAFDANHFTLEIGKKIATDFYGRAPTRSYMFGQSNGGRSGLVAIQRYPDDYDGVISLEPAIRQQAHQANLGATTARHIYSDKANWLSPAKVKLYAEAETKACDGLDGLKDGIIGNIEACTYIPTDLLCKGADNDQCLTPGQVESIRMIYADQKVPVKMADGLTGYPRFGRGGAATSDWGAYFFGDTFEGRGGFNYIAPTEAAKVVENNPNATAMTHDPVKHQAGYTRLSSLMDVTDANFSAFADRGGKLLIWYGLADTCVSVYSTADYVDRIKTATGSEKTAQFLRFLTSPGVSHNLDGPGAGQIDFIAALDAWVEKGVAPDKLVASRLADDRKTVQFQRPVCPFGQFPRYDGKGDVTKAASFGCAAA
jgi:feruloyl esterase